jgi:chromosomal replication initiation ATPase DnaA
MDVAWRLATKAIEQRAGAQIYAHFLRQLSFESFNGGIVALSTSTKFLAHHVLTNYVGIITDCLREQREDVASVAVVVRGGMNQPPKAPIVDLSATAKRPISVFAEVQKPDYVPPPAPEGPQPRTVAVLQSIVGRHYGVSRTEIISESRALKLIMPRQVAMYLSRSLLEKSTGEIGRRFGGRDHTTAIHAIRKIKTLLEGDADLRAAVDKITQEFATSTVTPTAAGVEPGASDAVELQA